MEIETVCRYNLPIVTIIFNNGGVYRGDDINRSGGADPAPTVLSKEARYEKLIEAFGGVGCHAVNPEELANALTDALASGKPSLINCAIDPTAGTESGHIGNLNPQDALARRSDE
jgi:oxalyl-CoA decarboxylase